MVVLDRLMYSLVFRDYLKGVYPFLFSPLVEICINFKWGQKIYYYVASDYNGTKSKWFIRSALLIYWEFTDSCCNSDQGSTINNLSIMMGVRLCTSDYPLHHVRGSLHFGDIEVILMLMLMYASISYGQPLPNSKTRKHTCGVVGKLMY